MLDILALLAGDAILTLGTSSLTCQASFINGVCASRADANLVNALKLRLTFYTLGFVIALLTAMGAGKTKRIFKEESNIAFTLVIRSRNKMVN